MTMENNIYLYGMILLTNRFLLQNDYPEADTYSEIKEKYKLPGGETGTCATVLASLGCNVKMDGTYMGINTFPAIKEFYSDKTVDVSSLHFDKNFVGLEDYVIIDKTTRTPLGTFEKFFSDGAKRWSVPKEDDIIEASVVGLDPFFQEQSTEAAKLCKKHNKPYVVIDCPFDSELHKFSSINILSDEFIGTYYKGHDRKQLFKEYQNNTNGLVIFTYGAKPLFYGRNGEEIKYFEPFKIKVVSTLGAGDTFKAGCVYALLKGMDDAETVRFASATAATACMSFPLPLNPPTIEKINELI